MSISRCILLLLQILNITIGIMLAYRSMNGFSDHQHYALHIDHDRTILVEAGDISNPAQADTSIQPSTPRDQHTDPVSMMGQHFESPADHAHGQALTSLLSPVKPGYTPSGKPLTSLSDLLGDAVTMDGSHGSDFRSEVEAHLDSGELTAATSAITTEWNGKYNVLGKIGAGNFGIIMLVEDQSDSTQKFAIKFTNNREETNREEFQQCQQIIAAGRQFQNLVQVFEAKQTENNYLVRMEYYEHGTLQHMLQDIIQNSRQNDELARQLAFRVFNDGLNAIRALTQLNGGEPTSHHDTKPDNIAIDDDGNFIWIDLGTVERTTANQWTQLRGTLFYASSAWSEENPLRRATIRSQTPGAFDFPEMAMTAWEVLCKVSAHIELYQTFKAYQDWFYDVQSELEMISQKFLHKQDKILETIADQMHIVSQRGDDKTRILLEFIKQWIVVKSRRLDDYRLENLCGAVELLRTQLS